ncbi:MAG: ATP-binding cassette domain-containing protein [Sedimentisphaerales bacterium]|jgi:ATP-binding cassette subfamily F protein uup|nr:ATP-binding cassette domain-containing protein [Sedimentisphaerales bacterium]HNY79883.1 ATP-binding cassette domain-containing protein [Sedimentisphaerales bacterium]HOC64982.1 ATP-binding cassette domain-containing protein [Sedimentisphaerales bacterium]HOH63309.1 ATP-binding cassette domain-containing protein [Sedimentisphaerales bacterium]HQA90515.1 ATP-binding cassette domain-containing protein [Sedimentisphaerales bacterium]
MALVSLQEIRIAFGGPPLLDGISLQIDKQQRIGLLGRNGAGKSTLMKILAGLVAPDAGTVQAESGLKIAYFSQTIPHDLDGSVFEIIARGLGQRGELMVRYHREEARLTAHPDPDHSRLHEMHEQLDAHRAWSVLEEIAAITTRMSLNPDWDSRTLSGGQKRRVLLAAALVCGPDLLLLDEPTNHLDIDTIAWLETYLLGLGKTLLFVTHDRMLLRRLATRIIEIDRGRLFDWSCDYDTFLERKQAALDAQQKEWERFDKKLAQEEVWIRQGIKARRHRNEGRVRALRKMRAERRARREKPGAATLELAEAQGSGTLVLEAQGVGYSYDAKPLIKDFNVLIARGDKVGIIGPNGCGKTTLVRLLLGELTPQTGTVRQGTQLAITYFDQLRHQLDEDKTVWENVLPNGSTVTIDGKSKHIIGYLQDFLFTAERAKTRARYLSGGERNRLLLARLFTRPANLLVLDEPTNDLDSDTLELLEELLINFKGTLLLICHDRAFLDNVVTSTLVFTGGGTIVECVGGYKDWVKQQDQEPPEPEKLRIDKKKLYREARKVSQPRKLSFKESKELESLPAMIESLEDELEVLHSQLADPAFYRNPDTVVAARKRLADLEIRHTQAFERWEHLESLASVS